MTLTAALRLAVLVHVHFEAAAIALGNYARSGGSVRTNVVAIELYYETLCPDCINFTTFQLSPLWNDAALRARVDLTLYPYGNAQTLSGSDVSAGYRYWHPELRAAGGDLQWVFMCQHGQEECFGNILHACLLEHLPKDTAISVILCMESKTEQGLVQERSSSECAQAQGVDLDPIRTCVGGPQGNELHRTIGLASTRSELNRTYVPWVMVNGVHSGEAEEDLITAVCSNLAGQKPDACYQAAQSLTSAAASPAPDLRPSP